MDGAMGKYFVFPPARERQSSVAFAAIDRLLFVNVDKKGKSDLSIYSLGDSGSGRNLRWHNIKWVVDPLLSESSLEKGVMPHDQRDLKRVAISMHMSYNHVAACRIDNQNFLISSLSNEAYDSQVSQAKSFGCQPQQFIDGQMVWKHLSEFYNITDDLASFIVAHRDTVVIASYENHRLVSFRQFSYDPDDGEIRDLLLTEVVPYLHHHRIIDQPEYINVIRLNDPFNKTVVSEMSLDFDTNKMTFRDEKSFQDLLIKICAKFIICDSHVPYLKRFNLPIFPFFLWILIVIGIGVIKGQELIGIYQEELQLKEKIAQIGEVKPIKPIYKAYVKNQVKDSLKIDVNNLMTWMTLSIPDNIWLTGMYVSPLSNGYFFSGYTREMNEPYILRNGLADQFGVNQNLFEVDFKSGSEYLIKIKEKNQTYTGALGRSQKDIQKQKMKTNVLAQYFELSYGNASKDNMSGKAKTNNRFQQNNQVLDKWW